MRKRTSFANWDELAASFRDLGGELHNVTMRQSNGSRGLFAIDPSRPVRIHIPDEILVRIEDIQSDMDALTIKPGASYSDQARDFFERYHGFTSWAGGGRESAEKFLKGLYRLPPPIKQVLTEEFAVAKLDILPGEPEILTQFIDSRAIRKKGQRVLMPVLELVNHAPWGLSYGTEMAGITLEGMTKSEVFARYSINDTWKKFLTYGFVSPERFAFSQTFSAEPKNGAKPINLRAAASERKSLPDGLISPLVSAKDGRIDISFLLLGDRKNPANPAAVFRQNVKPHLDANAEEFFETVLFMNRLKFFKLLQTAEGHSGEMVEKLRQAARLQLEALAACWVGAWSTEKSALV